jgi:hypothetical protein
MKNTKLAMALGLALGLPFSMAQAIEPKPQPPEQPEQPGKAIQTIHGNVDAVDTSANTLTVGGQVIYVATSTKLSKQGKTIQLTDILVGEKVNGTVRMTFDGKLEALTILVSPVK